MPASQHYKYPHHTRLNRKLKAILYLTKTSNLAPLTTNPCLRSSAEEILMHNNLEKFACFISLCYYKTKNTTSPWQHRFWPSEAPNSPPQTIVQLESSSLLPCSCMGSAILITATIGTLGNSLHWLAKAKDTATKHAINQTWTTLLERCNKKFDKW